MKAAALLRVSTEDQDLASQRHAIEQWAERERATVRYYEEPAVSGAAKHRPVLDQLMKDARRGKFEVLVVAALDRVGRDIIRIVMTLDELDRAGVSLVSLREGFDFRGPLGRAMGGIIAAVAEIERAAIQDRVRAGMARAKAVGTHCGRPRYEPSDDDLELMLELEAEGKSLKEIREQIRVLDQNGQAHRPSRSWISRALRKARCRRGGGNPEEDAA